MFPQSDKAADIIDALFLWVKKAGVTIVHTTADELLIEDGVLTAFVPVTRRTRRTV